MMFEKQMESSSVEGSRANLGGERGGKKFLCKSESNDSLKRGVAKKLEKLKVSDPERVMIPISREKDYRQGRQIELGEKKELRGFEG